MIARSHGSLMMSEAGDDSLAAVASPSQLHPAFVIDTGNPKVEVLARV